MIIITIDGPAACGKSTLAKKLHEILGDFVLIESGLVYRAIGYVLLQQGYSVENITDSIVEQIEFEDIGLKEENRVMGIWWLNQNVSKLLRDEQIGMMAAVISKYEVVRNWAKAQVRSFAKSRNIITEGRDTGSEVFPYAQVKIFLTASEEMRVQRRVSELQVVRDSDVGLVGERLKERDLQDVTRKFGALVCPEGATVINTDNILPSDVVNMVLDKVKLQEMDAACDIIKGCTSPRGTYDLLPGILSTDASVTINSCVWTWVEQTLKRICKLYGVKEIRTPVFESLDLFKPVGENSDIFQKEMFTFCDKKGRNLVLRPEGTTACMRAVCNNNLLDRDVTCRLFYLMPMFRYERPQAGRYREHYQFGIELPDAIGSSAPILELIGLAADMLGALGLNNKLDIYINYIADNKRRCVYEKDLKKYLLTCEELLSADARSKLENNVLRILDSKDPADINVIKKAPSLLDYISSNEIRELQDLQGKVSRLQFFRTVKIKKELVRGLSYYQGFVFEVVLDSSSQLGAHTSVVGGGGYELIAGAPFVGLGMGIERLIAVLRENSEEYILNAVSGEFARIVPVHTEDYEYALCVANYVRKLGFSASVVWKAKWTKPLFIQSEKNDVRLLIKVDNHNICVKDLIKRVQDVVCPDLDALMMYLLNI